MRRLVTGLVGVVAVLMATLGTAQAAVLFDGFDAGLDPQRWQTVHVDAAGAPWTISAPDSQGRLQISKPADSDATTPFVEGDVLSRFTLAGNFTVSIDYNLLSFPVPQSGFTFSIFSVNLPHGYFNVVRLNGANGVSCVLDGQVDLGNYGPDTSTVGTYKIQRQGDTISGYINHGSGFVLLGQWTDPELSEPVSNVYINAAETYPQRPTFGVCSIITGRSRRFER